MAPERRSCYRAGTIKQRFYKRGQTFFQVHRSRNKSAMFPLTLAPSTLELNYLAHDHICMAYPAVTLSWIGVIHSRRMTMEDIKILLDYGKKGFTVCHNRTVLLGHNISKKRQGSQGSRSTCSRGSRVERYPIW
jgi:hypothetical protein